MNDHLKHIKDGPLFYHNLYIFTLNPETPFEVEKQDNTYIISMLNHTAKFNVRLVMNPDQLKQLKDELKQWELK